MTELIKTIIIVGITIAVAVTALFSLPRTSTQGVDKVRNTELFEIDSDDVRRVRIVKFDGVAPETFEINKSETGWVLPSEYSYPADDSSTARINSAIRFLPNLIVTNVASDREGDKEKFGVIEPSEAAENIGQSNVGTLIELLGEGDQPLARAVIGARVEGDEEKSFVLVPGRPHIYVVELNPDVLSTDFRDWIDRDLLQFDPYSITKIEMTRVASATPTADPTTGEFDPGIKRDYRLAANSRNGSWRLLELFEFNADDEPTKVDVKKVNKANTSRFTQLANSFAELKIADVQKKPAGLKTDVARDEDYLGRTVNQISLREHGFFVVPGGPGGFRLLSKGGETRITLKSGVELLVRFGDFASVSIDDDGKANRYAIVSARVNEDLFPEPIRGEPEQEEPDGGEEPPAPEDSADESSGDASDGNQRDKEQEQIERNYLRQVQARKEKLQSARDIVERLNRRYLPWYYVVGEDSFESLTPNRDELLGR